MQARAPRRALARLDVGRRSPQFQMPIYSYRCRGCGELTDRLLSVAEQVAAIGCEHCQSDDTYRVIGSSAYHASNNAKTAKLDPRYEKMIDASMRNSASADEHRLLKKMTPFTGAKRD
ncbi:MAG: zinc ribbon domain-containing protein [Gammaproteobacteria bacterium]|nr:MAG: zinc ribbon domain-containing protein [Gammaproteobacteria bacterium]